MTDRFTIDVQDKELVRAIDRAAARLDDARPLFEQIGAAMERRINLRFEFKRDPSGVPWPPLTAATKKIYAKADGERKQGTLLERTGLLRASLGYNVLSDAVEIGFGRPYAAYHETGTKTKSGGVKMVRRGLLTADPESGRLGDGDRDAILQVVGKYLDDLVG